MYMSGFLIAIENVSAGLISLIFSTNPLILILLSALILKNKVSLREWSGIVIAVGGLVVAAIPNLQNNHASFKGIVALMGGITSFSLGSIYFSKVKLGLSNLAVNTWQITYGALLFIPLVLLNHAHNFLILNSNFYLSFAWLVLPVSIVGYGLWLALLQKDPVKAGKWLFLAPVLGYALAVIILKEPLTSYGIAGTILVLAVLIFSRKKVVAA
jgi:probable blue pigment (indigoidine) exporter